jgi:8-oxo-dGTP diphosphatase
MSQPVSNLIHVAVGVIVDQENNILIALRPDNTHQGGLWEFPGGKVELNENVEQALARELYEELAISVLTSRPLIKIQHDYGDKSVLLDVWWVEKFTGLAEGKEGQPIRWVNVNTLLDYQFPAANVEIVQCVQKALV